MMLDVPLLMPLTTPDVGLTVAIAVVPLVHVPPVVASVSVVVAPGHMPLAPPLIVLLAVDTVIIVAALQNAE